MPTLVEAAGMAMTCGGGSFTAHRAVLITRRGKMHTKMYGGGEGVHLGIGAAEPCPDGGKMYGWKGVVYILVWAYKKRDNISLFSKMYARHSPLYILESGKMHAPTSTCASCPQCLNRQWSE